MDDRRMLELAAKAAGHELTWKTGHCKGGEFRGAFIKEKDDAWNPLTSDGDAFRLAVRLLINIEHMKTMAGEPFGVNCWPAGRGDCGATEEDGLEDYAAATRLAITRAAAAIQQAKEDA